MIGRLKGTLIEKQPPYLLVDVQGVGYEVLAPMTTIYQLPELSETVILYTHFLVREDAEQLYGFCTSQDRALFRALIKVNGVGPKLALTILSGMDIPAFMTCIAENDLARSTHLPGIGKKTAERLIIEMRDRLSGLQKEVLPADQITLVAPGQGTLLGQGMSAMRDAVSALVALGYKPAEAERAVKAIENKELNSQDLIKRALQALGR
jgi:Holliday junction DNA helicase RuvA